MAAPAIPKELMDLLEVQTKRLDGLRAASARRLLQQVILARKEAEARVATLKLVGNAPFTTYRAQLILAQLDEVVVAMTRGMLGNLQVDVGQAARIAALDALQQARLAVDEYQQAAAPLGIERAQRILDGSKLREVEEQRILRGTARYSLETTSVIEQTMTRSVLAGESTDQAVDRLLGVDAWGGRAWRAERLARTEVSHAYNGASREVLDDVARGDDGLWLMWHEHAQGPQWAGPKDLAWRGPAKPLDNRVADDSLRLHGQLRRPGEPFVDPETRQVFMHPPNRPNDRGTVILLRLPDKIAAPERQAA